MTIQALKEAAEAATPVWTRRGLTIWEPDAMAMSIAVVTQHHRRAMANAQFIALANPSAILSLIARLEQTEEALKELNDALDDGLCNSGIPGFDSGRLGRAQDRARALSTLTKE